MKITLVTTIYNPDADTISNVQRIMSQAKENYDIESMVIDCSDGPLEDHFEDIDRYIFTNGYNLYYGGAMNIAIKNATNELFVYFSASRTVVNKPSWIEELCHKLIYDRNCGMVGCVKPCEFNRIARYDNDIWGPEQHVEGSLFAARTMTLKEIGGYSSRFPQVFSDVQISWQLMKHGYYLEDCHAISSLGRSEGRLKKGLSAYTMYTDDVIIDDYFNQKCKSITPINEHLDTLKQEGGRCARIVEIGVEHGNSTTAFLSARPAQLTSIDINPEVANYIKYLTDLNVPMVNHDLIIGDNLSMDIPKCDLLFIDTHHTYDQLTKELERHHSKVTRRIIMHDTTAYPECLRAVEDFLTRHNWYILFHKSNNNGLTCIERK